MVVRAVLEGEVQIWPSAHALLHSQPTVLSYHFIKAVHAERIISDIINNMYDHSLISENYINLDVINMYDHSLISGHQEQMQLVYHPKLGKKH